MTACGAKAKAVRLKEAPKDARFGIALARFVTATSRIIPSDARQLSFS
jgi:hypothetical protein